ncbi:hypothetical protein [Acinetobacter calcoaceticus]|uniref:hypothetical protein n=1 Tax=Acinetobacter calcoaceticus TaxID=471 RepID=UPI0022746FB1|nr:hypothetical protein [Acinetobacter calcoaceticus]GLG82182.1 hypothetical protein ACSO1_07040 [Acinetobacter calcoaceticus]
MKKYIFPVLVISLLSACSNKVLEDEVPKQAQGSQAEQELEPPVKSLSNEWDPAFNCDPVKAKKLTGKMGLTEKQVLTMTNSRTFRSAYRGEPVTEELRPDRITIVIDPKTKRIVAGSCG